MMNYLPKTLPLDIFKLIIKDHTDTVCNKKAIVSQLAII